MGATASITLTGPGLLIGKRLDIIMNVSATIDIDALTAQRKVTAWLVSVRPGACPHCSPHRPRRHRSSRHGRCRCGHGQSLDRSSTHARSPHTYPPTYPFHCIASRVKATVCPFVSRWSWTIGASRPAVTISSRNFAPIPMWAHPARASCNCACAASP